MSLAALSQKPPPSPASYGGYGSPVSYSWTGQDNLAGKSGMVYDWLPASMKQQLTTGGGSPYKMLLNPANGGQTLQQWMDARKDPSGQYILNQARPAVHHRSYHAAKGPTLGSAEQLLAQYGLTGIDPTALVGFSTRREDDGDISGYGPTWQMAAPKVKGAGIIDSEYGAKGYQTDWDEQFADYEQIGHIGALNDDVDNLLTGLYKQNGIQNNPQAQEAVKNALFKYDPRFGPMANKTLLKAASEMNNNRKQGFFEGGIGAALVQTVASIVNPFLGAAVAGTYANENGGSLGDIAKAAVGSYAGSTLGAGVGDWVGGAVGGGTLGNIAGQAANSATQNAVGQVVNTGKLDLGQAAKAGAVGGVAGGAGAYAGKALGGTNTMLGKLGSTGVRTALTQLINTGKINPQQLLLALGSAGVGHGIGAMGGGKDWQQFGSGLVNILGRNQIMKNNKLKLLAQYKAKQQKKKGG